MTKSYNERRFGSRGSYSINRPGNIKLTCFCKIGGRSGKGGCYFEVVGKTKQIPRARTNRVQHTQISRQKMVPVAVHHDNHKTLNVTPEKG